MQRIITLTSGLLPGMSVEAKKLTVMSYTVRKGSGISNHTDYECAARVIILTDITQYTYPADVPATTNDYIASDKGGQLKVLQPQCTQ